MSYFICVFLLHYFRSWIMQGLKYIDYISSNSYVKLFLEVKFNKIEVLL